MSPDSLTITHFRPIQTATVSEVGYGCRPPSPGVDSRALSTLQERGHFEDP